MALLVLVGAIAIAVILLLADAPSSVAWGVLLAAVPVGPLVGCFMWLDRYEPEPRSLLVAALLWGAFAATAGAVVLQLLAAGAGASEELSMALGAPITEEATKGIFLLLLLWWRRAELDGVLDGIVYAGMVGIGFAFTENILYLSAAHTGADEMGLTSGQALSATFVMRILASPFAHPLFTIFTGIGVGLAISARTRSVRLVAPVVGYALAVVLHGVWNASTLYRDGMGFLIAYVGLMFPVFVTMIGFAIYRRSSERHLLAAAFDDVARRGLIPATDLPWLVDLAARRRARSWARHAGGDQAARAMREYQSAAVELAFLHHRYLRGTAPEDFAARGQEHLAEMQLIRPYISFPGQVVPLR